MCGLYHGIEPPPPWSPLGHRGRPYTPLQPPKPLPWYIRDPFGALLASLGICMAGLLFIKFWTLLA